MFTLPTDRPRRKVRAGRSSRAVSLSSLKPVIDPFRATAGRLPDPDELPDPGRLPDPDELPDPCPLCGSADTMWFIDPRTTKAQLVCVACTEYQFDPADLEGLAEGPVLR